MSKQTVCIADILWIYEDAGSPPRKWYEVSCIGEPSEAALQRRLKRLKGTHLIDRPMEGNPVKRRFYASGKAGEFDNFIGKDVGDFIPRTLQLELPSI